MQQLYFSFVAAALALLGGAILRGWQYNRDVWLSHVKECDDLIKSSAELSCRYWLDTSNDGRPAYKDNPDRIKMESELVSAEIRILGHLEILYGRLSSKDIEEIQSFCIPFLSAMTGGNFMSHRSKIEPDMARGVYAAAAELSVALRYRSRKALSFYGVFFFIFRSIWSSIFYTFLGSKKN